MEWGDILAVVITFLTSGGVLMWVTLRDKKAQESERTAQAHETTRQEEIETDIKKFEYLAKRVEFAEQHIITLHKKMTGMQQTINEYVSRALYAEYHICMKDSCREREPKIGTYKPKPKKTKTDAANQELQGK